MLCLLGFQGKLYSYIIGLLVYCISIGKDPCIHKLTLHFVAWSLKQYPIIGITRLYTLEKECIIEK